MRRALILGSALVWLAAPLPAEETRFPAVLAGHAVLPALTLVPPPPDAPRDALVSGKFATAVRGVRNDRPLSFEGDTFGFHGSRGTSLFLPFIGQPVQGFSGFAMDPAPDGSVYAIIDNGFGSRISSPDALLSFARLAPDFATGAVDVVEQVWLRDPNRVVPFRLAYEGTEARYLTGADFDPESLQVIGEEVWIGDEFGPYLISAALDGVVTGVHEARMDGAALRSPDHPALRIPAPAGTAWRVPRSGGFEGLALQPGTGLLWAVLERPMLDETGAPEGRFLRA
ncbi:MAG: esterase-like activity of phytase family protein, partial [Pseudomonadota bacterium]